MSEKKLKQKSKQHIVYKQKAGNRVAGITGITKYLTNTSVLIRWGNKLGLEGVEVDKYVDELAQVGTCVHFMIECDLQEMEPDLGAFTGDQIDMARQCMTKYYEWKSQRELITIAMEKPLVSELHPFGGTGDWYGYENGELTYIDFKTAKGCYLEHKIQAVACTKLWEEHTGELPKNAKILRVGRSMDEGFEYIDVPEYMKADMWKTFTLLCEVNELTKKIDPYKKKQIWRKK
jgi:hypothetical protein